MDRWFQGIGAAAGLTLALAQFVAQSRAADRPPPDPQVGRSFRVPYRLTETNHVLVRVRIDGKGPFNFLVDTGAPAVFVARATARKAGLKPTEGAFWTPVARLDVEGGATLRGLNVRVDDPSQVVGMNALGLPGASIDGLLGLPALARFRIVLDPTDDRMTWTRLDFEPADPPEPARRANPPAPRPDPAPLARLATALGVKRTEAELVPRGFLGLELAEGDGSLKVARVLAGSPAEAAGLRAGDRLLRVNGRAVAAARDAREAVAGVRAGDAVPLVVRHDDGPAERTLTVRAGGGF